MAIKKPDIDIAFKQKATSSINKSERGIAILILKNDETSGCPSYAVYKEITEYEKVKDKLIKDRTIGVLFYRIGLLCFALIAFYFAISAGYSAFLYEVF